MISRVSETTASRIRAPSIANVPSGRGAIAPASRSQLSWSAMPRPCASPTPNRMERNADARNVG